MQNNTITNGISTVHLDFAIASGMGVKPVIMSYYYRSLQQVKSFSALLNIDMKTSSLKVLGNISGSFTEPCGTYKTFIQPIVAGKEKFYHAISVSSELNDNFLLLERGREGEEFYNYLMSKFDLPLMKEWGDAMFRWYFNNMYLLSESTCIRNTNGFTSSIPINGRAVSLDCLYAVKVCADETNLQMCIKELFDSGDICITKERQTKLQFDNMDSYFKKYGTTLVQNLSELLNPLTDLDGEAHDLTLKGMRLYPQQLAQVNGDVALLEHCNSAILNHGMGTGKTVTAAAIAESYFTRKWLRSHSGLTYADAYSDSKAVRYRNIVMCPGHLVEKWASEVEEQVPYARVEIIRDFKQLIKLRERGMKRTGKEWYVISKDFGKLSYQVEPIPKKMRSGRLKVKECCSCHNVFNTPGKICPECGSKKYRLRSSLNYATGMVCPHCNQILVKYVATNMEQEFGEDKMPVLTHMDFTSQKDANSRCYYCDEQLWQPHVSNIGNFREPIWQRVTHYSNKAHKGKKTVWVHKDYAAEYFNAIGEQPLNTVRNQGARKYSPVEFIKRYLRNYFDIAVFDEAHLYKGGTTGQGHAMHALIKASKKQLALTGTIAGGYANDLYYLLWRLKPQRMIKKGYLFNDEIKFVKKYGKLETIYEYNGYVEDGSYNACCKGRQKSSSKVKPGISPLIFMDFLLDSTTFLDLSDMSKYLPPLKEKVVSVNAQNSNEQAMLNEYKQVIKGLTKLIKDKAVGGKGMLSTLLQFSLSYADKPFGSEKLKSPKTGDVVAVPYSFDMFSSVDDESSLLAKELELIKIVNMELSEGRNCFIYAEYTATPQTCITYRLKEIVERFCDLKGKVAILESSSPKSSEREAWMHKQAAKGIKVFITNPRCVETGLDFCFKENGKEYNYPTIIFYQMGYSLFTIWQASRRSYRLNQRKECRVYYMALKGTIQPKVIEMIAEKQSATSAIQGKFSTEGLAAMANGTDARMKLAQSLSKLDSESGNNLQEMFDVLSESSDDDTYNKYRPMVLFKELVGEIANDMDETMTFDSMKMDEIENLFAMNVFDINRIGTFTSVSEVYSDEDELVESEVILPKKKTKKVKELSGQISLFNL